MKKLLFLLLAVAALTGCDSSGSPYQYTENGNPVHVTWPGGSCWGNLGIYRNDRTYSYKVDCHKGPTVYALSNFTISSGTLPEACSQGDSTWQKR